MPFEHPAEALGGYRAHPRRVFSYSLDVEPFDPHLKGVKHLREVPAIPGPAQTVQQRALQVSDPDPGVVNPDLSWRQRIAEGAPV